MRYRAVLVAVLALGSGLVAGSPRAQSPKTTVTVYKSPSCGCCKNWVEHMRGAGFDVKAVDVEDISAVKSTYGVPSQAASCHTSLVDGYVIEGHVPADIVKRVLKERPKVAGVGVPGMPIGSPGMEQENGFRQPYSIVSFDRSGRLAVYDRR